MSENKLVFTPGVEKSAQAQKGRKEVEIVFRCSLSKKSCLNLFDILK